MKLELIAKENGNKSLCKYEIDFRKDGQWTASEYLILQTPEDVNTSLEITIDIIKSFSLSDCLTVADETDDKIVNPDLLK